jgi:hypothetical protein
LTRCLLCFHISLPEKSYSCLLHLHRHSLKGVTADHYLLGWSDFDSLPVFSNSTTRSLEGIPANYSNLFEVIPIYLLSSLSPYLTPEKSNSQLLHLSLKWRTSTRRLEVCRLRVALKFIVYSLLWSKSSTRRFGQGRPHFALVKVIHTSLWVKVIYTS